MRRSGRKVERLKPIAIEFERIVPDKQEVESFGTIFVAPTEPEDWVLSPDELVEKKDAMWQSVDSPSGETLDVAVYISSGKDGFSMFVKQDGESVAQLLCDGLPAMTFRTLGGDLIALQAFTREQDTAGA